MRLWKKTIPSRFHHTVATMVKQKKTVGDIYKFLINSKIIDLNKHKKTEHEVL